MTKTTSKFSWALASFAGFVVFVYLFGLNVPLLGPDEPRYAQVAREMFLRGDWITPTLGGFHWFEKPALLYWLQITSYNIFGVGEFAARFGSALFGLGTISALWLLGKQFTTENPENTEEEKTSVLSTPSVVNNFPNYLLLISASALGLLVFARGASFDIIVTFPLTAAMVSYFAFDVGSRNGRSSPFGLVSFYFFIGLAVLAKGLIGVVFPFAIVSFYHLLSRRLPSRSFILSVFWGMPIAAAAVATWYLPMYMRHGWEFVDEFIIQHHFQRFTSNKYQHPQPFYFFWWVLPLMTFPWIPFFFGGVWKAAKVVFSRRDSGAQGASNMLTFALAWLLVPLVFFSFSGSKLPGYILPSLPPALVICAYFAWNLAQKRVFWQRASAAISITMLVVVFFTLVFALPRFADHDSVRSLIVTADGRGLSARRVLMFYTLSHNAEFYAAGRLLRDETDKQRVFYKVDDLLPVLANEPEQTVLLIAPLERIGILTGDTRLKTEVLGDNTELAIVTVAIK